MKNSAIPIIMGNFTCHNIRPMQSSKKSRSKRYKTVTNAINVIESSDENNQQEKFGQLVHFIDFYSTVQFFVLYELISVSMGEGVDYHRKLFMVLFSYLIFI